MTQFSGGYYRPIMDAVYDSLEAFLINCGYGNVDILFSKFNAPEPLNTYCIVDILQVEQIGKRDEGSYIPQGGYLEFSTHYKIFLQVTVLGDSAGEVATALHHNFNNRKCFEEFYKRNLSILNKGNLVRHPQLRETKWEDAFYFDTNLTFSIFTRQSYDWVEYVTINGEVFGEPLNP